MSLPQLLHRYQPLDAPEAQMQAQLERFLENVSPDTADPFGRDLAGAAPNWGHITGSAWVVNNDGSHTVLVHHAKLDKWVQPGGHCDGEADVLSVAVREAQEETGLAITPVDNNIFDIDVHRIPEYWNTPEHWHFDVRFLLQADDEHAPQASSESRAVRWVSLDEAAQLNSSQSIIRMITKTRQRFTSTKLVHPQKQGAMH
jgi:8-oxo-dGTP pyrophosphatase MutT (NUDIX family)